MNCSRGERQVGGVTLWFTGLPCSGKTTLSRLVFERLNRAGTKVELLDGDIVRQKLTKGLGFSAEDRNENIRRISYVCHLLTRNGVVAISAAISPYRAIRQEVRGLIGSFLEIYVECPVDICIRRDIKGMYERAIAGELAHFTGVSDPYEEPLDPDLILHTNEEAPEASACKVMELLSKSGYIKSGISAPALHQRPQGPHATGGANLMMDLHPHTTSSDGTLASGSSGRSRRRTGTQENRITDHHAVAGIHAAIGRGNRGIRCPVLIS